MITTVLICIGVLTIWELIKYCKRHLDIIIWPDSIDINWLSIDKGYGRRGTVLLSIPRRANK